MHAFHETQKDVKLWTKYLFTEMLDEVGGDLGLALLRGRTDAVQQTQRAGLVHRRRDPIHPAALNARQMIS